MYYHVALISQYVYGEFYRHSPCVIEWSLPVLIIRLATVAWRLPHWPPVWGSFWAGWLLEKLNGKRQKRANFVKFAIAALSSLLIMITRRFSNHVTRLLSRSHTFAIIVILDLKIHRSMWIHWPYFPKTWTKGHWPLDDFWPHVCWGHMCDSTQGSLCPSQMTIHQYMWIQWSILQNTTYTLHTYILHTTYRMSDHIVSYWTQFRRGQKWYY